MPWESPGNTDAVRWTTHSYSGDQVTITLENYIGLTVDIKVSEKTVAGFHLHTEDPIEA